MTRKLKITKKQAIKECKELWKRIYESGLQKHRYMETHEHTSCPLCEYVMQFSYLTCRHCPLITKFNKGCVELNYFGDATSFYLNYVSKL